MKSLVIDYENAYQEIGHAVGVLPIEGSAERVKKNNAWFIWWNAMAVPLFQAWAKFKAEQLSGDTTGPGGSYIAYGNRFMTNWDVYEGWHKRLMDLRDGARQIGIHLDSPPPASLPTTIVEDTASTVSNVAHHAWTLAEILAYGAVGVGGVVAIGLVIQAARSK